ncbi:hypothetical protein AAX28_00570 [Arcobacter porcinus]|uniref:Uncharacterized protein n=1 Tax=Arcobacter porcinus TaxID=1935204 RepID=A0ABX2YDF2_9BACT|nr:hypothetical protein AAX28_00570 [Arcobacter porcinus]
MQFVIIEITNNPAFNYFFTFPIYTMFISLPFIAIMNLFKRL